MPRQRKQTTDIKAEDMHKRRRGSWVAQMWMYKDLSGIDWDAQPACFITNYVLALQCFVFAVVTLLISPQQSFIWYGTYFFSVGATAAAGAFLHHLAYNALIVSPSSTVPFLGISMNQKTLDNWIDASWRIVMSFSMLSHLALFVISCENTMYSWIISGAFCYILFGIYAVVKKNTIFILVGFLPPLFFLGYNFCTALSTQSALYGIVALILSLASGIVQSLGVSPSKRFFNHNALSHVILSGSAFFMLLSTI